MWNFLRRQLSSAADFYAASSVLAIIWKYFPTCICILDGIDTHLDNSFVQPFWENFMQLIAETSHQFVFATRARENAFSRCKFRNFRLPETSIITKYVYKFSYYFFS